MSKSSANRGRTVRRRAIRENDNAGREALAEIGSSLRPDPRTRLDANLQSSVAMYARVLACDFDGTGATEGRLAPEVHDELVAARAAGIVTLLVTGRVLEDLRLGEVDFGAFDAVVAENGALIWFPATDRLIQLGVAPPPAFLGRLRAVGAPFHVGAVIVGTWEGHAAQALQLIREEGVDLQLVFNRAAVMLLPTGVNKAVGVRRALAELGRSAHNMVAFGDAENDLPLFALAEIAVAARGSVPAVARVADDHVSLPGPAGVAQYLRRLREHGWQLPTPERHDLELGRTAAGAPARLPLGGNVLVSGDPRSGKSWLGGLVAERLVDDGYSLCVIDPEGDYATLGRRPGVLVLGRGIALPAPEVVPRLFRRAGCSVVLTLTALSQEERCRYACALIEALAAPRREGGLPHWILADEAQYFFHAGASCCAGLVRESSNLMLVTYRPSLLADSVHATITAHLVTRTVVDEERYFVDGLLRSRGPAGIVPHDALAALHMPIAGLLRQTAAGPRWDVFEPGARVSPHTHHERKYAEGLLPADKGFAFRLPGDGVVRAARSIPEFCDAVRSVPVASLQHHLLAGDFSRWAAGVLGDAPLAAGLAKLERGAVAGASPSRDEIVAHVDDRYVLTPHALPHAASA